MRQAKTNVVMLLLMLLLATSAVASACLESTANAPFAHPGENTAVTAKLGPVGVVFGRVQQLPTRASDSVRVLRFVAFVPSLQHLQRHRNESWLEQRAVFEPCRAPSIAPDSSRAPPQYTSFSS